MKRRGFIVRFGGAAAGTIDAHGQQRPKVSVLQRVRPYRSSPEWIG
jgi:hypothetical protein